MKINLIGAVLCGGLLVAAPATGSAADGNPVGGSQVNEESSPSAAKAPVGNYRNWRARRLQRMQKQKLNK